MNFSVSFHSIAEDIPIYNYVSSVENPLTWGQFTDQNIRNGFDYPFSEAIWYISFHMHKTAFMNRIYMVFLHLLPGLLMDFVIICAGKRPRLLKLYQKIHKFSSVISFFCTNEWVSWSKFTQKLASVSISNFHCEFPDVHKHKCATPMEENRWSRSGNIRL